MDIVDAQVHLFMTMDDDVATKVMDGLGIRSVLIDECWDFGAPDDPQFVMPAYRLPNGKGRPIAPGGIKASLRRPDRFAYLLRVHPEDPEMEYVMSDAKASPGCRALRLDARFEEEVAAASEGRRLAFFKAAERSSLPVFVCTVGQAHLTSRMPRRAPRCPSSSTTAACRARRRISIVC